MYRVLQRKPNSYGQNVVLKLNIVVYGMERFKYILFFCFVIQRLYEDYILTITVSFSLHDPEQADAKRLLYSKHVPFQALLLLTNRGVGNKKKFI